MNDGDSRKVGIISAGAYVPRFRLSSGAGGTRSVLGPDEDRLTMAAEAARNALERVGCNPARLASLIFASSSVPRGQSVAASLALTLGASPTIATFDLGGSGRGGTAALEQAVRDARSSQDERGLVLLVVADAPDASPGSSAEAAQGAAAVALLIGATDPWVEIRALAHVNQYFPYLSQPPLGGAVADDDPRLQRDVGLLPAMRSAVDAVLEMAALTPDVCRWAVLGQPSARGAAGLTRSLGLRADIPAGHPGARVGDTGAAASLLELVVALEHAEPGDQVLLASYGTGAGADAVVLRALDRAPARGGQSVTRYLEDGVEIDEATHLRWRRALPHLSQLPDIPVSLASFSRAARAKLGLVGGRCSGCGAVNYPPRRAICLSCHHDVTFEDAPLARRGEVHSYTTVHFGPSGIPSPYSLALVDLMDGVRILVRATEAAPGELKIGQAVELVLRRAVERPVVQEYAFAARSTGDGGAR